MKLATDVGVLRPELPHCLSLGQVKHLHLPGVIRYGHILSLRIDSHLRTDHGSAGGPNISIQKGSHHHLVDLLTASLKNILRLIKYQIVPSKVI